MDAPLGGTGEWSIDVGIGQELEIFGQRGLRIAIADADRRAQRLELEATRQRVRAEARAAYFDVMFAERRAVALERVAEQAARLDEAARLRANAGAIGNAERVMISADLAEARAEARTARADVLVAQSHLAILIGQPPETVTTTIGNPTIGPPPPPLATLLTQARDRRLDLRATTEAVTASKRELDLRRRERLPNPTLLLSYSKADDFVGLSVAVGLPLFRTGRGEIAQARGRIAEALAERDQLRAGIDESVAVARARYDEARQRAVDLTAVEAELETLVERYEQAYSSGSLDLTAFLAVRDRILHSQLAALTARHDAVTTWTALEVAVGGDLEPRE